jgi:hypothetical protein
MEIKGEQVVYALVNSGRIVWEDDDIADSSKEV